MSLLDREIKFRALRRGKTWWYSSDEGIYFKDGCLYEFDEFNDINIGIAYQYTGLKDKNGVDIYEGDILRQTSSENEDIMHIVIYSEDDASFLANNIKLGKDYTCSLNKQWCIKKEVIGNIYEKPELLEA